MLLVAGLLLPLVSLGELRQIYILQTTDVHTQFFPGYDGTGGMLGAATVIRKLLSQNGRDKTLLIDTGDTVQGSSAASYSNGEAGLVPLRELEYDVWIPGNHEFDFGLERCWTLLQSMQRIVLCANLRFDGRSPFPPWRLFYRNGVSIAVIGLSPSYMHRWLLPDACRELIVTPGKDVLKSIMPQIHTVNPDVIVLATHQALPLANARAGSSELEELARAYPEIDVVLGGHSHQLITGKPLGPRAWFMQAGKQGSHVGMITLTVDTETHRVTKTTSVAIPVLKDTPLDEPLREKLAPYVARAIAEEKKVIESTPAHPVFSDGTPGIDCPISELFCQAIAETTGAEVVFHGKFSNKDLNNRKFTVGDLRKILPYDNTIVTALLTPREIAEICGEQWNRRKYSGYNGIYGAYVRIRKDRPAELVGIGISGNIPPGRVLVAFNNHAAAGSGRFVRLREILEQPSAQLKDTGIQVRESLVSYLKAHPDCTVRPTQWILRK